MPRRRPTAVVACAIAAGCSGHSTPQAPPPPAGELPVIAVGLDAYRQWDRWPALAIGARTYMRSTYDRAGGNEGADASHFLRARAYDTYVPLDVAGRGVLHFVRANHWHGSPWRYAVDGRETIVQETSTADPDHPAPDSTFVPAAPFPPPLALTWSSTRGSDLSWVPIPFTQSFELAYGRTFYGTGYYIYSLYADDAPLSQPLAAWDGATPPSSDVVDLVSRAGEDIAPTGGSVSTLEGAIDVPASGAVAVARVEGSRTLRALRFTAPRASAIAFGRARLRVTWDARDAPSIDAPIALFFGAGTLFNRDGREWLVKSLPASIRFPASLPGFTDTVELSSYWPMPFFHSATIEIVGGGDPVPGVTFHARSEPYAGPTNHVGYLHATYRDHGAPVAGKDLGLLDTAADEGGAGGATWCGKLVGTSFVFSDRAVFNTLEGDPRFFFDDSSTPQAQGTGTEEWGGGGDYWGGQTTSLPFAGHPVGAPRPEFALGAEDQIESAYRFLLGDAMPFGRNARIQLEHGGDDTSTEHYRTVTFWYGLPGACLEPTDALHVGDPQDEAAHRYVSPDASAPETVSSRYEVGVDHLADGTEVVPETSDVGRHTTGTSEFTLRIGGGENFGVLLRRKVDYAFADQRAEVWVADDRPGAAFEKAGVWYLAGSNTCLYAWPKRETDVDTAPIVETSNRRWRDDEFLLPRRLTDHRTQIRVRVVATGSTQPLEPGGVAPPTTWSEFRYAAYAWVLPPAQ